jgi:hypothetical protein
LKSQEQIAKVFLTQGVYYRDNFNFFEAIKKFKQGVTYLQKNQDSKQLSKLNYYLADSYSFVYSDDIAFKYFGVETL